MPKALGSYINDFHNNHLPLDVECDYGELPDEYFDEDGRFILEPDKK